MDVGSFSSHLSLFLSFYVLGWDSYDVFHCSACELFGLISALHLFFWPLSGFLCLLWKWPLSFRGAIRRTEDAGESRSCPKPYGGRGSHRRGDIKRLHLHLSYGVRQWPYCSWGMHIREVWLVPVGNSSAYMLRSCLTPHIHPQAFTVVAVFNSMTFALKVTPLAVRSLSEGAVAIRRFQVRIECGCAELHYFCSRKDICGALETVLRVLGIIAFDGWMHFLKMSNKIKSMQ